ncbi:hypothetical protein GCM10025875_18940 [Litorihabitans aurantiacus]|uniref:Uncharacterized protein n=1 Tax=Litorihabitans aurantiacus TaxID=1930061 RepID=A0AA38CTH3_9MICO|nr:hypothetical protein GCM10025875_18940 [Litorihabitans aurantiacus]
MKASARQPVPSASIARRVCQKPRGRRQGRGRDVVPQQAPREPPVHRAPRPGTHDHAAADEEPHHRDREARDQRGGEDEPREADHAREQEGREVALLPPGPGGERSAPEADVLERGGGRCGHDGISFVAETPSSRRRRARGPGRAPESGVGLSPLSGEAGSTSGFVLRSTRATVDDWKERASAPEHEVQEDSWLQPT